MKVCWEYYLTLFSARLVENEAATTEMNKWSHMKNTQHILHGLLFSAKQKLFIFLDGSFCDKFASFSLLDASKSKCAAFPIFQPSISISINNSSAYCQPFINVLQFSYFSPDEWLVSSSNIPTSAMKRYTTIHNSYKR